MRRTPPPKAPQLSSLQDCIHDLLIIVTDETFWIEKKTDPSDMTYVAAMKKAVKKFKLHEDKSDSSFLSLQTELLHIASQPRKSGGFWSGGSGSSASNPSIINLKIAVQDLSHLQKSLEFNKLRKEYATFRKDNEMLNRATPTSEKKHSSRREAQIDAFFRKGQFITALFLSRTSPDSKQFTTLLSEIKKLSPTIESKEYTRHPALETLMEIIKDDEFWKSQTPISSSTTLRKFSSHQTGFLKNQMAMKQAVTRYEKLSQLFTEDVSALNSLDIALLKSLQNIAKSHTTSTKADILLHEVLHSAFDNFDHVQNSEGFSKLDLDYKNYQWRKSPLPKS